MRWVLAMLLMVGPAAAADEDFPKQCYRELMVVTLLAMESRCPHLQLTFAGHEMRVDLAKSTVPACLSAATSKSARDADDLKAAWCPVWMRIVNKGREKPLVTER